VLALVHVAIGVHILHWLARGETLGPLEPSESVTFAENSVVTAGLIFFVASIAATLVFGRFFCGWACHMLAVQDLCLWLLKRVGIRPKPMRSRALLLVPIGAFVYMFLYPPLYRLWFGIDFLPPTTEFQVENFWRTFPPWPIALLTFAVAGFAVVYFLGAKGFCVNMCPYGAAYGLVDRLSPGRIRVTDACEGCGHCTQVCTSNVVVHKEVRDYGMVVDQECLKCLDCVSVCPKDALYFGFGKPALLAAPRQAGASASAWWKVRRWRNYRWPEELLLGALFLAALFAFRGLYNSLPFLFSLAFAGLFAYLVMQALRLVYRPRVQLQGAVLKADGRLTGAGRLHAAAGLVLLGLGAGSGYVNHHRRAAEAGYVELQSVVAGWLNGPRELDPELAARVASTLDHAERAERWTPLSLLPAERWELSMLTGWLHLLQGDEAGFEERLQRAAAARPGNAVAHDGLANFHAATGRVDEALGWFGAACEEAPGSAEPWLARARYLLGLERAGAARDVLLEATRRARPDPALWVALGRVELQGGSLQGAIEAFQGALAVDGDALEAHLQLGGLLTEAGDLRSAAVHQEAALRVLPDDFQLRLATTLTYSRLGELDAALGHARAARDLAPERPEPFVALARISAARGDEAEAERLMEEARLRAEALENP
jgi:polyferredoxin/Flp pilus assembly protein TadD